MGGAGPAGATGRIQGPAWGRKAETVRKRGPGQPSERAPGRLFSGKCQPGKGGRPGVCGGLKRAGPAPEKGRAGLCGPPI